MATSERTSVFSDEEMQRATEIGERRDLTWDEMDLLLDELTAGKDDYAAAGLRFIATATRGLDFGLKDGKIPWTREELYERRSPE